MQRCPNCMELKNGDGKCPVCGHFITTSNVDSLTGKTLNGRFLLGRLFKQAKDFKYYIGWDNNTQSKVTVCCFSGERFEGVADKSGGTFTKAAAVDRFLSYSRSMASCGFCSLLPRMVDVFYEDGMGYAVTVYIEGQSLKSLLQSGKEFSIKEADKILDELLKGIKLLHNYRMIFGAISPENLYISKTGALYVLGVGTPFYENIIDKEFIKEVFDPYYSAPEVFSFSAKKGRFTDIYSAAAVYYRLVTGLTPPSSFDRFKGESIIPLHRKRKEISKPFSKAISNAMNWQADYRTKNVAEFLNQLSSDEVSRKLSFQIVLSIFLGYIIKLQKEFKTGFKGFRNGIKSIKSKIKFTPEQKKKAKRIAIFSGLGTITVAALITVVVLFANGTFKISIPSLEDNVESSVSIKEAISSNPLPEKVKCPEVVGLTLDDAEERLEKEGLKAGKITERQVPADRIGLVIDQAVDTGEEVARGKKIDLLVGVKVKDKNLKEFPNIIGKELTQAVNTLEKAGFLNINVKFEESDSPVGKVVKQSAKAGQLYNKTKTYSITVSGKRARIYDFCGHSLSKVIGEASVFSLSFVDEENNALEISEEDYSDYLVISQSLKAKTYGYVGQKLVFTLSLIEQEEEETEETSSDKEASQEEASDSGFVSDVSSNNSSDVSSKVISSQTEISSKIETSSEETSSEAETSSEEISSETTATSQAEG